MRIRTAATLVFLLAAASAIFLPLMPAQAAQDTSRPYVSYISTQAIIDGFTRNTTTYRNPRTFSLNVRQVTSVWIYQGGVFQKALGTFDDTVNMCGGCSNTVKASLVQVRAGECAQATSLVYDPTSGALWNSATGAYRCR